MVNKTTLTKIKQPIPSTLPPNVVQSMNNTLAANNLPVPQTPNIPAPIPPTAPANSTAAATPAIPTQKGSFNDKPQIIYSKDKGVPTGIILPNGKQYLGISPSEVRFLANKYAGVPGTTDANAPAPPTQQQQIQAEIDRSKLKQQLVNEQSQSGISQEQIGQIGQLSPEQQLLAAGNPNLSGSPDLAQIAQLAGQKAATAAAIGATGGGATGSVVPGLGTLAGAGLGALGGAIVGAVTGTFAAYNSKATDNVNLIQQNIEKAQYNIRQSQITANRGGDPELSIKQYNDAVAQLILSERQLKIQSQDVHEYLTHAKNKQIALKTYMDQTLPSMRERLILALQKPDPNFVDYGLDSNGVPIQP